MSNPAIARAVERKRQATTIELGTVAETLADGVMVFDEVGSPVNRACGLGVDGPVSGEDLDRIVAFYDQRQVPATVEVGSYAHESVVFGLGARGFVLDQLTHVFARDLVAEEDVAGLVLSGTPPGVTIEPVDPDDENAVRTLARVVLLGFYPDPSAITPAQMRPSTRAVKLAGSDAFLARIDGEVVGGGRSESGDGMTALMGASVLPSHRGRGIQRALMSARIEQAWRRGSRVVTVGSAPGGPTERNAVRLGFRMVCMRFRFVRPHASALPPGS